jgi:hypothetical protein
MSREQRVGEDANVASSARGSDVPALVTDEVSMSRVEVEEHARIAEYSGRGALEAWVHVVAVRAFLDLRQREKQEVPTEHDAMLSLVLPAWIPSSST